VPTDNSGKNVFFHIVIIDPGKQRGYPVLRVLIRICIYLVYGYIKIKGSIFIIIDRDIVVRHSFPAADIVYINSLSEQNTKVVISETAGIRQDIFYIPAKSLACIPGNIVLAFGSGRIEIEHRGKTLVSPIGKFTSESTPGL